MVQGWEEVMAVAEPHHDVCTLPPFPPESTDLLSQVENAFRVNHQYPHMHPAPDSSHPSQWFVILPRVVRLQSIH